MKGWAPLVAAALVALPLAPAASRGDAWAEEKCARYAAAWTELLSLRGDAGLGPAFLSRHDAFIAGGCVARADVCPRSPAEFEVANAMTVAAMNAGAASTFPPFACRE